MTCWQIAFELLRLAAQFCGALFIAWMTVNWALGRYKREKLWERRLSAYTDLLAALDRMHYVLGQWELEELKVKSATPAQGEELRKRYQEAHRSLEEAWGVAQLLLSPEIAKLLASLDTDVRNAKYKAESWMEAIGEEWVILQKARATILEAGRKDLQAPRPRK
ncbi:MAG: hypothetical protein RIB57_13665 [Pelagibacterium sp.]|uniref:hypothetical protein n=1 Tax=Pelagibacterium sp. TaxID=1967288 RepID=UPI0032EB156D